MERFLKAKHWQVFIMTYGIPFILELILGPILLIKHHLTTMIWVYIVLTLIFIFTFWGWCWAVAIDFPRKLPNDLKLNTKKFKLFFIITLIWFVTILIYSFATSNITSNSTFGLLLFLVDLFAVYCLFYNFYFVSKSFKTMELQRKVTFSDFAGEFFLILFYPVGVWILQPKINKMIENK